MTHLHTRIIYWLTRHIVQRIIAPRLLDERDAVIEFQIEQIDRWTETAQKRGRDNRKLMREICGRIRDFEGASSRLPDAVIYDTDPSRPKFHFVLPRDATVRVERTASYGAIPQDVLIDKHTIDIQDFAARCRIGLECPEDYDLEQLRLATGVILMDKLARFVTLHCRTGLCSRRYK